LTDCAYFHPQLFFFLTVLKNVFYLGFMTTAYVSAEAMIAR
jgi:hypothetical protein